MKKEKYERTELDVIEFETAYSEAFRSLEAQLYDLLIDGQIENVQALKLEITRRIFELCERFDIVDKYLVFLMKSMKQQ